MQADANVLSLRWCWAACVLLAATLLVGSAIGEERGDTPTTDGGPVLVVQTGHAGRINSACFSPDGRHVLTGGGDATARLWELATGREVLRFEGHSGVIWSVAISPDGRHALTGGMDTIARLWEVETGKEIRRFEGHLGWILAVAFSPDGRLVLTGGGGGLDFRQGMLDPSARLWETATGKEVRRFEGHPHMITSVSFSPDGRHILTGGLDSTARLWETATGKEVLRFEGHSGAVQAVCFAPDGRHALTGSGDDTALLWECATGKEVRRFAEHSSSVYSVSFSPDGRYLLTGSNDQTAWQWETGTGKRMRSFQMQGRVASVSFSQDGRHVLTGSWDGTARVWEAGTGKEIRHLRGHVGAVTSVAFSSDGQHALVGSWDKTAGLWAMGTGREVRRFRGHAGPIHSVAFSANGRYVLTGGGRREGLEEQDFGQTARLWETATGKEVRRFEGHSEEILSASITPDGRHVVTASADKTVRLWDAATGEEVRRFEGHTMPACTVVFSPDGRHVLTGSIDYTARLWETVTGKEVHRLEHSGAVMSVAFSADGRHVLTGGQQAPRLWEIATGKELRRFGDGPVELSLAGFSPDGRHVLTWFLDQTVRLWETATGKEVRRFEGRVGVASISFAPDGRYVLTGGDGTALLWETATGRLLCTLARFDDGNWAVVTPDGRFDTGDLDSIDGLHWVLPDDPLRAVPLELFMRDYFEPGLMVRALAGEALPKLPRLDELNRALPLVRVTSVAPDSEAPGQVRVAVEVEAVKRTFVRKGKTQTEHSGADDLRLFRDGKLVRWIDGPLDVENGRAFFVFDGIPIDTDWLLNKNVFSAYAFNTERVKSLTHRFAHPVPDDAEEPTPTAYVIGVGVDVFDQPRWNLSYAAADARAIVETLSKSVKAGDDAPIVSVLLTSEKTADVRTNHARKQDLQAVLAVLAGEEVDKARLAGIENADKLRKARPEDVVVISISTHGVTGKDGKFYLLPSDAAAQDDKDAWLASLISADELSHWLRGVDAGEMAMIVDACQSAASVEQEGFKPGPMGSRGLGQLAYDKRMRILAASQAAEVALESRLVKHGLLTYALLVDGVEKGRADFDPKDGKTTLDEWLRYGLSRVPTLAAEVAEGKVRSVGGRGRLVEPGIEHAREAKLQQQPSLFDFSKGKVSRVTLSR